MLGFFRVHTWYSCIINIYEIEVFIASIFSSLGAAMLDLVLLKNAELSVLAEACDNRSVLLKRLGTKMK